MERELVWNADSGHGKASAFIYLVIFGLKAGSHYISWNYIDQTGLEIRDLPAAVP